MNNVKLDEFVPFAGDHCETVATGTLLNRLDIDLPESVLFGLGEGLSFLLLNLSSLPLPFVGGRVKPFTLTQTLCDNLGLHLQTTETTSKARAFSRLKESLTDGVPVALQLDCYYLEYFSEPVHFAGHFVAAYGLEENHVLLVDTRQQGCQVSSSIDSVEKARFEKGPMSARARSWTITGNLSEDRVPEAAIKAIRGNARAFLNPQFKGATYFGIQKLAKSLPKWLEIAKDPENDFPLASLLMERAGTGGSIFRVFYRDFLHEIQCELPKHKAVLKKAELLFEHSAENWRIVSEKIGECGATLNVELLQEAAELCEKNAEIEVSAMEILAEI